MHEAYFKVMWNVCVLEKDVESVLHECVLGW